MDIRQMKRKDGSMYSGCTGITNESKIAICYIKAQHESELEKNGYYILRHLKEDNVIIQFMDETKVAYNEYLVIMQTRKMHS